ncbi:class I SAM-dependent methyltransferase [Patulibacter sp. SYSU D01012]|uniref:class I SAM-dependent methyltransferase n=1 Tax=Patulibacter sp. SYSU D01012 TaxID=2817381 RepID=UPI001B31391A|nr:class I SAM-dependent methyltransferase [Patulibacter sp. SYSU D01012]
MTARPSAPAFAADVLDRWDAQQAAYVADREGRFRAMLDVLALSVPEDAVVVDLACGPGSLAHRVLERLPGARVVAVDVDPLLLAVAADRLGPEHGARLTLVDADLATPGWSATLADALAGATPHAVVSSTALHWLPPSGLLDVYAEAATLLPPGGVLLNGDHFRFDDRSPALRRLAAAHDEATQRAAFAAGAPTWDAWWDEVRSAPGAAPLAAERDRRFADRPAPPATAVDLHLAALAQAGFAQAGTVWQLLDDYVVLGVR